MNWTVIFGGISVVLYLLGMYQMNDWIPSIEHMLQKDGFEFSPLGKVKVLVFWPVLVVQDMIDDAIHRHSS